MLSQQTKTYIEQNKPLIELMLAMEPDETATIRIEVGKDGPVRITIELIAGTLLEVTAIDKMFGNEYFPDVLTEKVITANDLN